MQKMMSNTRFMFLWILGTIFALVASFMSIIGIAIVYDMLVRYIWGVELGQVSIFDILVVILFTLLGLATGILCGTVQKTVLKWKIDAGLDDWTKNSAIGGILGGIFVYLLLYWFVFYSESVHLIIVPFACISFVQMFSLRKYVHGAWVWVVANIVGAWIFYHLLASDALTMGTSPILRIAELMLIGAAPGIVTGFAMLWLLNFNWKHDYLDD